jgi:DNA primase catalytic subunit
MEIKDYLTLDGFDIINVRAIDTRPLKYFISILMGDDSILYKHFEKHEIKLLREIIEEKKLGKLRAKLKENSELRKKVNNFIITNFRTNIDGVVTMDTSRLIRVPYSLHGKTGLIKKKIEYEKIDDFNPLMDAVRDDEYKIKINIIFCPKIFWFDEEYGPFYSETAIIPFSLGIYLIERGLAYGIQKYK